MSEEGAITKEQFFLLKAEKIIRRYATLVEENGEWDMEASTWLDEANVLLSGLESATEEANDEP